MCVGGTRCGDRRSPPPLTGVSPAWTCQTMIASSSSSSSSAFSLPVCHVIMFWFRCIPTPPRPPHPPSTHTHTHTHRHTHICVTAPFSVGSHTTFRLHLWPVFLHLHILPGVCAILRCTRRRVAKQHKTAPPRPTARGTQTRIV